MEIDLLKLLLLILPDYQSRGCTLNMLNFLLLKQQEMVIPFGHTFLENICLLGIVSTGNIRTGSKQMASYRIRPQGKAVTDISPPVRTHNYTPCKYTECMPQYDTPMGRICKATRVGLD